MSTKLVNRPAKLALGTRSRPQGGNSIAQGVVINIISKLLGF